MTIKTKCIFARPAPSDGVRVLITRFLPNDHERLPFTYWCPNLAPSAKLVMDAKKGRITWKQYKNRFAWEMRQPNAKFALKTLALQHQALSPKDPDVTLLCIERVDRRCHRRLVKILLDRRIAELEDQGLSRFDLGGASQ